MSASRRLGGEIFAHTPFAKFREAYRPSLPLLPKKTRMVDLRRGQGSFVFLGCTIRKKRSIQRNPRMHFMQRWPSPKAMKRIRERVHELTDSRHSGKDCQADHRDAESYAPGMGKLLPDGECRAEVQSTRQPCLVAVDALDGTARRATARSILKSGPMNGLWVWACISCAVP